LVSIPVIQLVDRFAMIVQLVRFNPTNNRYQLLLVNLVKQDITPMPSPKAVVQGVPWVNIKTTHPRRIANPVRLVLISMIQTRRSALIA
jgi:hypothetical protein